MQLGKISRALALTQAGDYKKAAGSLLLELQDIESSSATPSVCEWIAACAEKLEKFGEAAAWYETAGEMTLAGEMSAVPVRASDALYFFKRAHETYVKAEDDFSASRILVVVRKLESACVPQ